MSGFEATEHNRLEQLMINVLNEQIQYFYNQVTFTWEMVSHVTYVKRMQMSDLLQL